MPDPDRDAREPMDAPGTRVTPEPDEHANALPREARRPNDISAQPGRSGLDRSTTPNTAGLAAQSNERIGALKDDQGAAPTDPDPVRASEGGTGSAGSRGGGPAADFSDQRDATRDRS